jgi:hypothetical protein
MQGVYLAAAELTKRLVTDDACKKAGSVQVKTNFGRPRFWLVNKHSNSKAYAHHATPDDA